jgi:hypothetical protein
MRPRVIMVLAIATIVLGGVLLVPAAYARLGGGDTAGSGGGAQAGTGSTKVAAQAVLAAPPPPTLAAAPVTVPFKGSFSSWALLDRTTGKISGAKNITATNSTESMIKIWIVSDYLRRLGNRAPSAERLKQASVAILDSNDTAAESLYSAGGRISVIQRLIDLCGLTETKISQKPGYESWWSFTEMSPRDAVRMGECVKSGKGAGPKWTKWVLDQMSKVRGTTANKDQHEESGGGRWGIIDGLPETITAQGPVSIKNGWTVLAYDSNWHVNCLAVTDRWVLAVMMRYPQKLGLAYGAGVCAGVATQLVTPHVGAALKVPKTAPAVSGAPDVRLPQR